MYLSEGGSRAGSVLVSSEYSECIGDPPHSFAEAAEGFCTAVPGDYSDYFDNTTILGCGDVTGYWSDEMSSFPGLTSLDMEPLPSLLPFSPCQTNYKSERPGHDMADVLLSLKHAVLRGEGAQDTAQANCQNGNSHQPIYPGIYPSGPGSQYGGAGPQASLSYTVHPQMLISQSSGNGANYAGSCYETQCTPRTCQAPLQHCAAVFPSMSVNVSMNMTMHGYEGTGQPCSQMQWSAQPSPSLNVLYPPLLSPAPYGHGGTTYSFTADFRPPANNANSQNNTEQRTAQQPTQWHYVSNGFTAPKQGYAHNQCHQTKMDRSSLSEDNHQLDDNIGVTDMRPNMCRLCGKTYARPSTLKTHLRTHSGERPYRCPECSKSFSQAANLTAHVRTHTGQKPFRCPVCDRRFSQSSSVTTHMRTHSGERPYRCRACKKAFSDSSTLTKHLRIHSGEKPYQCKLCLLRFSQSGNLNRHMRVHGNNSSILGT